MLPGCERGMIVPALLNHTEKPFMKTSKMCGDNHPPPRVTFPGLIVYILIFRRIHSLRSYATFAVLN